MEQLHGEKKSKNAAAKLVRANTQALKISLAQKLREDSLNSIIGVAVSPLLEIGIQRTILESEKAIADLAVAVASVGGDLEKLVPYPSRSLSWAEKSKALKYREFVYSLVERVNPDSSYGEVRIYKMAESKCSDYILENVDKTKDFFVSFIGKLNLKVGECVKAELVVGSDVWGFSVLSVSKSSGAVEKWKTQMIVNCSGLGTLFNQWPTRKIK